MYLVVWSLAQSYLEVSCASLTVIKSANKSPCQLSHFCQLCIKYHDWRGCAQNLGQAGGQKLTITQWQTPCNRVKKQARVQVRACHRSWLWKQRIHTGVKVTWGGTDTTWEMPTAWQGEHRQVQLSPEPCWTSKTATCIMLRASFMQKKN